VSGSFSQLGAGCPAEWLLGAYVDRGLEPDEVRSLEAHLVGCQRCRRSVVALEAEGSVLKAALRGEAGPEAPVVVDARGMVMGFPLAIVVALTVASVLTFLLETRLPSGAEWLHPTRLLGVNEMILDFLFALRSQGSGWLQFAVSVGLLAGLAALASFVASVLTRRLGQTATSALVLVGLGLGVALAPVPAEAVFEVRRGEEVHIGADERFDGTLIVSGESLIIDGTVAGDVFAFCERIQVRGIVEGNLIVSGREVEIDGSADVVVAGGEDIRLGGRVVRNAYLGGDRVTVESEADVGRDLVVGGGRLVVEGDVQRDLAAFGERLQVDGAVGRDVSAWAERVRLLETARVGRNLIAHMPDLDSLDLAAGATIGGETTTHVMEDRMRSHWDRYRSGEFYAWLLIGFVASFVLGIVLYLLMPSLFDVQLGDGRAFLVSMGTGFAALVLVPVIIVLTALTIVGIPLALVGLGLFLLGIYLASILVAAIVGRALLRNESEGTREFGLALLAGLALLVFLKALPFVGKAASVVILLVGAGVLVARVRRAVEQVRRPV
jgi:cytoskeletal protein CcmA (bactofilin family)